jgi:hypothetical protein
MAKPNYRQVKRQKEMARKNRQQEKLDRRVGQAAQTANGALEAPADVSPGEAGVTDPSDARP